MYDSELMSTSIVSVQDNDSVEYAARLMSQYGVGSIPVVCGQALCGMLTDRDIVVRCIAQGKIPKECRAGEIMTGNACCIAPRESISKAVRLMGEHHVRRLPVVENSRIRGMLSIGDIARATGSIEDSAFSGRISLKKKTNGTGGKPI